MATQRGRSDRPDPPNESALIGREGDLAALVGAAAAAARGQGQVVLISGEVGAGKTTLARAFLGRGQRRDDRVFAGRAYEVESRIPYAAFTDAFQSYLRTLPPAVVSTLLETCGTDLAKVFPALRVPDESLADATASDAGVRKARVFDAFYRFLRGLIPERGSLIVFLDDLHWADNASLELWHFLAHSNAADRMLLIGSYRAEESILNSTLEHVLASLRRLEHCREIVLEPLTPDQLILLVQRALGRDLPLAPEFAAWLESQTKGNPLFTSELVRTLVRLGRLRDQNGEWAADLDQPIQLPQSIRDAFHSRLEALGEDARHVLTVAVVLGGSLDFRILQLTTDLDDQRLIAALDELQELQILVEHQVEGLVGTDFAHPLMRETIYEHLSAVHRGHLHGRIALALESLVDRAPGVPASQLALHFSQSADPELRQRAIPHLIQAGEEALIRYANREAIGHLRTALSLLADNPAQQADRIHVLEWIGLAEERVGTLDQAVASWRTAITLAEAGRDPVVVARLHRRIGRALWQLGDEGGALAEFRTGLAALGDDSASIEAADLHQELAQAFQRLGQIPSALEEAQLAVETSQAHGAEGVAARAYTALVAIHGFSGRLDRAEQYANQAIELVERHHWPRIGWRVHYLLAVFATHHGHTEQARQHADQCLALAIEIGAPILLSSPLGALAALDWQTGEWDSGIEAGERAIALDRQTGQLATLPRPLVFTAALHQVKGDVARSHAYLDEALTLLDRLDKAEVHMRCLVYGGLAWHHLLAGDFASSEHYARLAVDLVDTRQAYPIYLLHRTGLPTLAEAQLELGDLAGATSTLDRLLSLATEFRHRPAEAGGRRVRGRLLARQGRVAEGLADLDASVTCWRDLAQPYELARALRDRGQARLATGEKSGGPDLQEARETWEQLGAEREAAAVRQILRSFGIRAQRRHAAHGRHPGGLTVREVEIVRLAAEGLTNREIADQLFISPLTAETHLRNVLRKLSLHSRAQLADFVERNNLL
ncbi:MAG TPA: AAA family ATPase [Dehalococcoidia bacterium]|nr:AAA family ATPase [Dehalococcoidia bacterium]